MNKITENQINNLYISPKKPLLIVDADEVIVYFVQPFSNYLRKVGWEIKLRGYRLDDAITSIQHRHVANKETYQSLIRNFIRDETHRQPVALQAKETLKKAAENWQIVILSNVPHAAYYDRLQNLANLDIPYPLVSNAGGKGTALAKLASLTESQTVFIDDNPFQIQDAALHAPTISTIHFTACDIVRSTMPYSEYATYRAQSWKEVGIILKKIS